ncbi:MAG: hypothetical protein ACI8SR_002168 [Oceanicoccus sp.]|jgi:hypothetical protein
MLYLFSLKKFHIDLLSITLLLLLLFFVASTHIGLRENPPSNNKKDTDYWLQPRELDKQYPQLISRNNWALDFIKIEEIINGLQFNSNKPILITDDMTEKLQLITAQLDHALATKEWKRLQFLIIKSLGNKNGNTVYELVDNYYHYQKAEVSFIDKIKQADNSDKLRLLNASKEKYHQLQIHYFGIETAKNLFNRQNKTTNYLNSRQIVILEKGLNRIQKKDRLLQLSNAYKQSLMQQ